MKNNALLVICLVLTVILPAEGGQQPVTIALCRPTISQIRNIDVLYEKDLITIDTLHLICVYHEDELTDYAESLEYVRQHDLDWVSFYQITGSVAPEEVYKENRWTPRFRELFHRTAGIIFTGGMDLPPVLYDDSTSLLSEVLTPIRSIYETSFLFHLIGGSRNPAYTPLLESDRNYVILGLCLGCQTLNVAAGGTLIQDIPTEIYRLNTFEEVLSQDRDRIHSARYLKGLNPAATDIAPAFHRIRFVSGSRFHTEWDGKITDHPYILTSHHQAIKELGKDLTIAATSMDGKIIEAVEHRRYPQVLGVQFHPEYFALYAKGLYFRRNPGGKKDFNLRKFLMDHRPSMDFHVRLWRWFSLALAR